MDLGSHTCKAGYAGEDAPKAVFPSTRHSFSSQLFENMKLMGDLPGNSFIISQQCEHKWYQGLYNMIVGFCENGDIYKAKSLLDEIEVHGIKRDLITWNAMLSGYVDNDLFDEAVHLFNEMLIAEGSQLSSYTLGSVLSACSGKSYMKLGKEVHCQAIKRGLNSNPFVAKALMELYFRSRLVMFARQAVEEVRDRDVAIWNNLISGYARFNQIDDLPILLNRMKQDGFIPNAHTWNGIISGHVKNDHRHSLVSAHFRNSEFFLMLWFFKLLSK